MARAKQKGPVPVEKNLFALPAAAANERQQPNPPLPFRSRVLGAARRQLDRFAALQPKVLKGDNPDAVHDIRVASRRLQQILDLLYPDAPSQKIRKLRRAIRRSRKVLSAVRNYDVLLARAERTLHRRSISRRQAWEVFHAYLREQRERSFRKASRRLSKLDLPAIYVRLRESFRAFGGSEVRFGPASIFSPEPGSDPNTMLCRKIENALEECWSMLESCVSKAQRDRDAAALHAVRIAAKKTRYLIEVIHILEVPGSDQSLRCLRRVQRRLGDWHDLEVLEETMLEMVADSGMLREQLEIAMDVEQLVLQNRKRKRLYEKKFFQMVEDSGEWHRLVDWVQSLLATGLGGRSCSGLEDHSMAFPPSKV